MAPASETDEVVSPKYYKRRGTDTSATTIFIQERTEWHLLDTTGQFSTRIAHIPKSLLADMEEITLDEQQLKRLTQTRAKEFSQSQPEGARRPKLWHVALILVAIPVVFLVVSWVVVSG